MCKKVFAQPEIPQDILKLNGRAGYPKKDKLPLKVHCLHKQSHHNNNKHAQSKVTPNHITERWDNKNLELTIPTEDLVTFQSSSATIHVGNVQPTQAYC